MADVTDSGSACKKAKITKQKKKRSCNPEEWHKHKQKKLRIAGKEYINANGQMVSARSPGPDCNCRRACYKKVPEEVRQKIFDGLYSMNSHDEQNAYLFGLMRQVDIKRKRNKESFRRTCTFEYFVRVKGREVQICQTAFKNIHAITERKVRVLCKKMDDGVMYPTDNRGKNSTRIPGEVRLPPGVIDQIKNHIFSIIHTHQLKDFIRLDKVTGLEVNISKMWKDYIKKNDPENYDAIPKGKKRLKQMEVPQQQQPVIADNFETNIQYNTPPGHLMNITENFFAQSPYQPAAMSTATTNYFPTQTTPILLQPAGARPVGQTQTAYIFLQPNQAMQGQNMSNPINYPINTYSKPQLQHPVTAVCEDKSDKNHKKRGPLVKQWRYTNIFHDEINGAAFAAIKTRLAMYYSGTDSQKKINARTLQETHPGPHVEVEVPILETVTVYTCAP